MINDTIFPIRRNQDIVFYVHFSSERHYPIQGHNKAASDYAQIFGILDTFYECDQDEYDKEKERLIETNQWDSKLFWKPGECSMRVTSLINDHSQNDLFFTSLELKRVNAMQNQHMAQRNESFLRDYND